RRFGAAALDLAYVAVGRTDGFWESHLRIWDVAAGILMVREAGGFVSDQVDEGDSSRVKNIVAGNEIIHAELKKVLKKPV
ncbi:inositol monophosphatase family protein, partial [Bartonella bacilliformis]